jgi:hypothetical protein
MTVNRKFKKLGLSGDGIANSPDYLSFLSKAGYDEDSKLGNIGDHGRTFWDYLNTSESRLVLCIHDSYREHTTIMNRFLATDFRIKSKTKQNGIPEQLNERESVLFSMIQRVPSNELEETIHNQSEESTCD